MRNALTVELEGIMQDYGGTKWRGHTLNDFKDDVFKRIDKAAEELHGPQKMICTNLKKKLSKSGSVQDMLLILNESYFSLIGGM